MVREGDSDARELLVCLQGGDALGSSVSARDMLAVRVRCDPCWLERRVVLVLPPLLVMVSDSYSDVVDAVRAARVCVTLLLDGIFPFSVGLWSWLSTHAASRAR